MIARLLFGLLKGLIVGGLLGFAAAKAGFAAPGAVIAYLGAAVSGVLVGLIAGKPIWAKDAKIEAGMKAIVGALLGGGLMWAVRHWLLSVALPFSLGALTNDTSGTVGGLAITSFAIVAAVLGAFYDADNTPAPEEKSADASKAAAPKARIAASDKNGAAVDEEEPEAPAEKRAKR
jgi:hypothetical protein